MKRVLLAALLMAPMAAYAQTSPNVTQGQVWTIPQWNAFLASKADTANPVFTGTINGAAAALSGNATIGGTLGVTGAATFSGGLSQANTFSFTSSALVFVPAATFNGTVSFAKPTTVSFSPTYSGAVTPNFLSQASPTGSATGSAYANQVTFPSDTVNSTGASSGVFGAMLFQDNAATGFSGERSVLNSVFNMTGSSGNTSGVGGSYVAGAFHAQTVVNDNGTGLTASTARGLLYGINPVVQLGSGATYYTEATADESDCSVASGASVLDFVCMQVVTLAAHASGGARDDVLLSLNSQSGAAGVTYGLEFGRGGGFMPVKSTGTLIYGQGNVGAGFTVANGIDWHLGTFTGNTWNDGHIAFTGAGDALMNSATPLATTATTGFLHLPNTTAAPTGTPTNTTPGCEWNTGTHTLNCYDGTSWYHFAGTAGAG